MKKNMFYFLILKTLISFVQSSTKLKEGDKISLIQVEYGYNATRFELSLKNRDYAQINDLLSSRIAFLNNTETDNMIFELYSSYINRYWLFLVNSSEVANNLLLRDDYLQKELYINGIIIPKRLQYKLPSDNKNPFIPIFELNDSEIDYLSLLDIRNTKKNIYFIFDITRVIGNYPETYLLINALVGCLLGLALLIYWKILIKVTRFIYVFTLHKFLYTLPFFITVLGVLFISKAIDLEGRNPYQINDDSMFLDTALFTINSIYRTLLWFFILLICCGWKITVQTLRTEDLKFLMRMLLITYVVTSLDQMIDSSETRIWVFNLTEIKNLIFYIVMLFLLLSKIKKSVYFLQGRLYYARTLSLEYVEALSFKIRLINKNKLMIYSYLALYVIMILVHKIFVYPYDTNILELYDYHLLDIYLSIYFLLILRPQELPPNFNVDFGNDIEGDIGLIYKSFLPKYSEINKKKINDLNEITSHKDKNMPIIILGPCLNRNNNDESSINNYINNIEIGFKE